MQAYQAAGIWTLPEERTWCQVSTATRNCNERFTSCHCNPLACTNNINNYVEVQLRVGQVLWWDYRDWVTCRWLCAASELMDCPWTPNLTSIPGQLCTITPELSPTCRAQLYSFCNHVQLHMPWHISSLSVIPGVHKGGTCTCMIPAFHAGDTKLFRHQWLLKGAVYVWNISIIFCNKKWWKLQCYPNSHE